MNISLALAALAFAVVFNVNVANAAQDVSGDTDLAGTACNSGTDIAVTSYNIDYGSATASQFAAGATDINGNGTKSGGGVVALTDYCGTYAYNVNMTFATMTGADNGDTITNGNHESTYTSFVDSVGNLEASTEVDGNPSADAPWLGSENALVIQRTTTNGAVGVANLTMEHTLDIPASTLFDTSYDGTWRILLTIQ
ncbi:MAG: hypothetical protein H6765_10045 [Candidatus Peribacteria bacterium]|nr:MAG: hypothetical protein H6765_10045 [Candidatus Peribacteria bacterium]